MCIRDSINAEYGGWYSCSMPALSPRNCPRDKIPRTHVYRARTCLENLTTVHPEDDVEELTRRLPEATQYCHGSSWEPGFVARLIAAGFIPMSERLGTGECVFLPKLHQRRCLLLWPELHKSKNAVRRSKGYSVTVDQSFDVVWAACLEQHGKTWLHDSLRRALRAIWETEGGIQGVQMHTFELWDTKGQLVAGELGASSGGVYTSFTGFSSRDHKSAGSIQMICTAELLERAGYEFWDLGMEYEYKVELGARVVERAEFLSGLRAVREVVPNPLNSPHPMSALELIKSSHSVLD
eukprot:TRINITY_DN1626_c0_g1_i1.p1 TRINITY_DN1626_c0_g1~~TRINITY_DN1626_c0_g1_i1.p1  ORF type:complete len:295 (+),score=52.73 TRINITY_DN1626_c0_g1_i1:200-1084(+)